MKYRDPKTGEVFEDIYQSVVRFCRGRDCDEKCPIDAPSAGHNCRSWAVEYPADAARLMGMEVITDKEEPMEKTSKPRFTEEEVAVARSLQRVWPDGKLLRRAKADLVLTSYHYGFTMPVPQDMFSGLCQGQSITLCDIVGGEP